MPPKRFQIKRKKGWKMPANGVYVGRPTKWGNPFKISTDSERAKMIKHFETWLGELSRDKREELLEPLKGKDLGCWCPLDKPCHADVLLREANR